MLFDYGLGVRRALVLPVEVVRVPLCGLCVKNPCARIPAPRGKSAAGVVTTKYTKYTKNWPVAGSVPACSKFTFFGNAARYFAPIQKRVMLNPGKFVADEKSGAAVGVRHEPDIPRRFHSTAPLSRDNAEREIVVRRKNHVTLFKAYRADTPPRRAWRGAEGYGRVWHSGIGDHAAHERLPAAILPLSSHTTLSVRVPGSVRSMPR